MWWLNILLNTYINGESILRINRFLRKLYALLKGHRNNHGCLRAWCYLLRHSSSLSAENTVSEQRLFGSDCVLH